MREAVEELKQDYKEGVDKFDNNMKEVIKREEYRIKQQELAK